MSDKLTQQEIEKMVEKLLQEKRTKFPYKNIQEPSDLPHIARSSPTFTKHINQLKTYLKI